ncbi:MAG: branched-chain amino acid ABC transporter permease [Burkholderiaceae bacterium]|nr:branched-chain amino acid ABC transporter permease [Burkholderiaceae bacterium]
MGTLVALPALRLSGMYLALATLSFAMAVQWVFLNWNSVTFGAGGFRAPKLDVSPIPLGPDTAIYYLSWIVAAIALVVSVRLVRSRHGRSFIAVRDGEMAAQALGVNLLNAKFAAFAISAVFAGTAGVLYTPLLAFVSPESFDLFHMIMVLAMVIVGGLGSIAGTVIGVVAMFGLIELLRDAKAFQEILLGVILVNFALLRPDGLAWLLRNVPGWRERLSRGEPGPPKVASGASHTSGPPAPKEEAV